MESEKSGFTNEMSEVWRKMQVKSVNTIQLTLLLWLLQSLEDEMLPILSKRPRGHKIIFLFRYMYIEK